MERHTNICSSLFDVVKHRLIDEFNLLELDILEKGYASGESKRDIERLL